MAVAVFKGDYVSIIDSQGTIDIPIDDYNRIRHGIILNRNMLVTPNSVIQYLQEINPRLIGTEMSIERDKMRRRNQEKFADMMKYALPFAIIIIAGVIAFKMLTQGDSTAAVSGVQNALAIK